MPFSAGLRCIWVLRGLQAFAILGLVTTLASGQAQVKSAAKANYKQAQKYSTKNLASLTYDTVIMPMWIGKTDAFWYRYRTSKGTAYWRVDPVKKTRVPLFDRDKLASQLAELSRKPVDANNLDLVRGQVSEAGKFTFVTGGMAYEYDLGGEKLVQKGKATAEPRDGDSRPGFGRRRRTAEDEEQEKTDDKKKDKEVDKTKGAPTTPPGRGRTMRVLAPDRTTVLFIRGHNLYVGEKDKEKDAVQLSRDGAEDYEFVLTSGFGGMGGRTTRTGPPTSTLPRGIWAKDSKHFYATRQDSRGVEKLFVIDSLANPRPKLEQYKYPMPGEEKIRKSELHVGSVASKRIIQIKPKWRDESYTDIHWGKAPGEIRFVRIDRLRRNLDFCSASCDTGECKVLLSEGFENAPLEYQTVRYLDGTDEMIWWSERSGWGHFYLYERNGKLKNAITSGAWRASRIVHVDEKNRLLYFQGNAREKGENAYYEHLYRVKFDGSELTLLDSGDASQRSILSPTRQFLVANASRIDRAPESVLRDASGKKVMDLEKADLSRLQEYGWRLPETFTVKAADGVTDLYGNLWKPFDFDPRKKYPIIAHVYPGPQTEGVTHTFSVSSTNMQLAQLGFIVIQVGHRGGAPTRSKAYASYGYYNLRDYGLADKKVAIEQLAARHGWIDITKVGIYGHSGGAFMSAAALLQKPYNEFFKAAVASAGNHDNNIYGHYWAERYHGMKEVPVKESGKTVAKSPDGKPVPAAPPARTKFEIKVPTNAELAANLKGRLLLVHGEIDNNVHPANTMRLVDALIKANKRFDMLIIPGKRHSFGDLQPYFTQRMWEFFAEHLIGERRGGADLYDKEND